MKLEIKQKKKNPLMKRDEVRLFIDHTGKATPRRADILDEVAGLLKTGRDSIIIDRIITSGGQGHSEARVLAYSKKQDIPEWRLKKMEGRMAKKKGKTEEQPEAAPEAREEQPEEKPAESPQEVEVKPGEGEGAEKETPEEKVEEPEKAGEGAEEKPEAKKEAEDGEGKPEEEKKSE